MRMSPITELSIMLRPSKGHQHYTEAKLLSHSWPFPDFKIFGRSTLDTSNMSRSSYACLLLPHLFRQVAFDTLQDISWDSGGLGMDCHSPLFHESQDMYIAGPGEFCGFWLRRNKLRLTHPGVFETGKFFGFVACCSKQFGNIQTVFLL